MEYVYIFKSAQLHADFYKIGMSQDPDGRFQRVRRSLGDDAMSALMYFSFPTRKMARAAEHVAHCMASRSRVRANGGPGGGNTEWFELRLSHLKEIQERLLVLEKIAEQYEKYGVVREGAVPDDWTEGAEGLLDEAIDSGWAYTFMSVLQKRMGTRKKKRDSRPKNLTEAM